ncbi:MAG: hypothetical protein OHK0046_11890 [Anaerolineae bacterium]
MARRAGLYNLISIIFLLLTVGVIVFVGLQLAAPEEDAGTSVAGLPTAFIAPTATPAPPSATPRPTLPPTFTNTPTVTPTLTNTVPPTATVEPSPTITDTPQAASPAPEGAAGGPPVEGASPEGASPEVAVTEAVTPDPNAPTVTPPPVPYLFDVPGSNLFFTQNTNTSAGCAWQGIAGSVLDGNNLEIAGQYQVRVFNETMEQVAPAGSNSFYGTRSGWEIPLENGVSQTRYFVRLETTLGTQISRDVEVIFPGTCQENLAIVRFVQTGTRPGASTA